MKYIGNFNEWHCHVNNDGFIEAFKSIGKKFVGYDENKNAITVPSDSKRIVTSFTDIKDFLESIKHVKKHVQKIDNQLKLF